MKKIRRNRVVAWLLGSIMGLSSMGASASAFDGPTHRYVTDTSLSAVNSEFKNLSKFYNSSAITRLLIYCVKPDEDENDGAYKFHFFNPITERNFVGEVESALTRFVTHYRNAVRFYKSGKHNNAWEELGRAIHFLEDLNTPVHTNYENVFDAGAKLQMHVEFEKRCVELQEQCKPPMNFENIRYYLDNVLSTIGQASAYLAADNFYPLENELESRDEIARNSIENAQKAVIGLLYRFYVEVSY